MIWLNRIQYFVRGLGLRLRFLFREDHTEAEMDEELRFHLAEETGRNVRAGMSPQEARRKALIAFGGEERIKEQIRDARGVRPLQDLGQDLRFSLRQMVRAPLFTGVAILTLAIGIGANTAIFSVVNGALLRDRPFRDSEGLVHVYTAVEGQSPYATAYEEDLRDLRTLDDVFLDLGAFRGTASRIQEGDGARMVLAEAVTSNLFPLVGIEMAHGRGFTREEDVGSGDAPVAILGHVFWKNRYGGDPGVIGQDIRLAGTPFTIVGVAPERFESFTAQSFAAALFVPFSMAMAIQGESRHVWPAERGPDGTKIVGRLRNGVNVDQAQARADGLMLGLYAAFPQAYEGRSFNLHPARNVALQPDVDAFFRTVGALLMGAVGLVLLLAATNLASSLLARGIERHREMAVRLALGARRGRLVRQLLTETCLVASFGAIVGILLGGWCLDVLTAIGPPTSLPLAIDTRMDARVLLFTLCVTMGATLLAGLAPALKGTNPELMPTLKDGGRGGSSSGLSLRNALVAIQMAISMVLLISGGLFVRSLQRAEGMDPGFAVRDAGMVWVDLNVGGVPREEWEATARVLAERARALPGVDLLGTANSLPLSESLRQVEFTIPGVEPPPGREALQEIYLAVDHDYLRVMGLPVVSGRGITPGDRLGTEPVVLVSEAAVRRFWPGENPLGMEIQLAKREPNLAERAGNPDGNDVPFHVVGVVKDTKVGSFREGPTPLLYFPRSQFPEAGDQLWLVATGSGAPPEIAGSLRRMVREVNPELVIIEAKTVEDHLSAALFLPRLGAALMGFFGLVALVLASVGLYGLVSFAAARRAREVGIRMSLGAGQRSVVRLVVGDGMKVVLLGGAVGFIPGLVAARYLGSYLIGVTPHDLVTLIGVPFLLFGVAYLAALNPARKASRVNPVQALKME